MLKTLAAVDTMSFTRLQEIVSTNYGNLSLHARRLEGFGYITIEKTFVARMPRRSIASPRKAAAPCARISPRIRTRVRQT